jgi:hypothetical protein
MVRFQRERIGGLETTQGYPGTVGNVPGSLAVQIGLGCCLDKLLL